MDNNEQKILELSAELSRLREDFEAHRHTGTDSKSLNLDTTVDDTDVVFTDNTTNDASTDKHGYLPKLSGTATEFLNGDGNFTEVAYLTLVSDTLQQSADTERSSGGDPDNTYTIKKDIEIKTNGSVRIKFDLRTSNSGYAAYGRIYKNGSPVGTQRSTTSGSYVTYSEDFDNVTSGDNFQLYIHNTFSGGSGATAFCRNFRVYFNIFEQPTVVTD